MKGMRIGVFICQCGNNIGRIIDVPKLAEELKSAQDVVWVEHGRYLCSEEGLAAIRDAITKFNLNRVVIGACTPRNLEKQFSFVCQDAGLNPYLLEMVNLREQCSWVHLRDTEGANTKARELLLMGVAKSKFLEPQSATSIDVSSNLIILGGGISGMTAALSAARQGHQVLLLEKEPELGGLLRNLDTIFPGDRKSDELIRNLVESVNEEENIEVMTGTTIFEVEGSLGRYRVKLTRTDGVENAGESVDESLMERSVGAIILATGADEFKPEGHYHYGENERIMTGMELEEKLRSGTLSETGEVVFIQCVGARGEEVPYCARVCCITSIKNALKIKEAHPDAKISILHRDIFVAGALGEELYRKAWDAGIQFHYYNLNEKPEVELAGETIKLTGIFGNAREELTYEPDLLVLSTPLVYREGNLELSKLLRIPLDSDNFFLEKNPKIYPMDTQKKGIYLCGCCHEPAMIAKCIAQGQGAASRAAIQLSKEFITLHPMASVDYDNCRGCGRCIEVCPNDALEMVEDEHGRHAKVNDILCQGCGTCCATCWTNSIHMNYFHSKHLNAMIGSLINQIREEGA
jgi:heterodisulfide reductase subunit A